jgi:hypothetical protein
VCTQPRRQRQGGNDRNSNHTNQVQRHD